MSEQHWLSALHVRIARQVHRIRSPPGTVCTATQRVTEFKKFVRDHSQFTSAPQSQRGHALIVAAPARVQLSTDRATNFGHPAFDCGVDVFLACNERKRS